VFDFDSKVANLFNPLKTHMSDHHNPKTKYTIVNIFFLKRDNLFSKNPVSLDLCACS